MRVYDIQIIHESTDVAAVGDVQRAPSRIDRLLLRLIRLVQHGQAGYVVLHFAKSIQNAIAIGRYAGVVARFGELHLRTPRPAREDAFRDIGADCPERALDIHQLGDIGRLPATISKKIQRGIVGSTSNTDLRVSHGHLPFRFRDIGPPLQQIRRQTGIERRRFGVQLLAGQVKVRGGFPEQDSNCIFKLFPLLQEQNRLRPRGIQERLFLCNIQPGGHAAFVTLIDQLQSSFQRFHSAVQNSQLRIELP